MKTQKVKDYKTLVHNEIQEHEHVEEFDNLIKEHIEKGYVLYGNPYTLSVSNMMVYTQAMVLLDEVEIVDHNIEGRRTVSGKRVDHSIGGRKND